MYKKTFLRYFNISVFYPAQSIGRFKIFLIFQHLHRLDSSATPGGLDLPQFSLDQEPQPRKFEQGHPNSREILDLDQQA
jgi:hypothetical protein